MKEDTELTARAGTGEQGERPLSLEEQVANAIKGRIDVIFNKSETNPITIIGRAPSGRASLNGFEVATKIVIPWQGYGDRRNQRYTLIANGGNELAVSTGEGIIPRFNLRLNGESLGNKLGDVDLNDEHTRFAMCIVLGRVGAVLSPELEERLLAKD